MLRGISRAAEAACIRQGCTQVISGGALPMCTPLVGLPGLGPLAVEAGVLLVSPVGLPLRCSVQAQPEVTRTCTDAWKCNYRS